jgi:hypothetical protein
MANKKITELPFINTLSGSLVWDNPANNTVLPVVLRGTTNQITIENFSRFMNLYTATTGSSGNIFVGPQTINNNVTINGNQAVNGNVTISGTLRVNEIVAQYETSSILFSTGSTKLGDQITDKHEFTGSTNITGSFIVNGANLTDFSASNSATFTNFSSSNSATFTNFSSSNAVYVTALSSSNSATFTNFSSSNSTVFTNYSSSNSTVFTNFSSSNSTVFTNYSSSNSTLITNYSSSINTTIYTISASIDDTLFAVSASIDTTIYTISASIDDTLFAVSASINTNIYAISSSIDSTIKANLGATNDVVYRIQQATASIQSYTASLKTAILPNGTNLDVFGNLRVSGSTTLGDTNTDKVEVTGSVNITGYVSASGINIYSTGTPEILSTNNLRLTADSSVVITTDNSGTAKVWDFDNGGTINLPGGATISTPNTVDVIVAAGSAGAAQLANFNKGNYFAINDTLATINVDAGATNKVWQFTNVGSINLPGSIIKPDGGEYSASLTLTSSFHAFTASIGSTSNDYRIELNSIEAYTASLKSAAIVSSSTQVQNYDLFALNSNLYTGTGSIKAEIAGIEAYTASLKAAAIVSSSQQIKNYIAFVTNDATSSMTASYATMAGLAMSVYTPSGTANRILYQSAGGASSNTTTDSALTWNSGTGTISATSMAVASAGTFKSALDGTNNISLHDGSFGLIKITNGGIDRITLYRNTDTIQLSGSLLVNPNNPSAKHQITGSVFISGSIIPDTGVGTYTSSFSLGSATNAWKDIWVSEGSIKFVNSLTGTTSSISLDTTTNQIVVSNLSINTASLDDRIATIEAAALSASYFTSSSQLTGSFDERYIQTGSLNSFTASFNAISSSLATTGSNVFYGTQTISGSLEFATGYFINMPWESDTRTIWERYFSGTYFQRISSNGTARQLRLESNGAYGNASIVLDGQSNTTTTTTITSDKLIATGDVTLSTGNLIMGTSGKGIDFSATVNSSGSMTSELLNDYEEGTWAPTVRGSGTPGTYELATDYTTYTKIGRQVTLNGQIKLGTSVTGGGTGYLQILGAPFTKAANTVGTGAVVLSGINFTGDFVSIAFASLGATNTLFLSETVDNSTATDLPISAAVANAQIQFTITYFV